MKIVSATGALLVFLLMGCAQPYSDTYGKSRSDTGMQGANPAVYHAQSFGDADNQPFQGSHPNL